MIVKNRQPIIIRIIFTLLPNALAGYIIFTLLSHQIFPTKYVYVAIAAVVFVNLLVDFLLFFRNNRVFRVIGCFLSILVILISAVGVYLLTDTIGTLNKITSNKENSILVLVIVAKDSDIYLVPQLNKMPVSVVKSLDDQYVNDITKDLSLGDAVRVQSYTDLIKGIYDGSSKVILFNEAYRNLIKSEYPDFDADTRIVKQFSFETKIADSSIVDGSKPFNLYISGIDTYGPIATTSLSDVNIVVTINPITKKMLLTTVPRDSYLPIAAGGNNQFDKLTHAGIYGIDSSVGTIENLLGIDIGAYVRVNFTSLIGMVDVVGGVEVDNPVAFNSSGDWVFFSKGINKLDGKEALIYSRERKNLANGDNDRGKNQERVIIALFKKAAQPSNLTNYQSIMSVIGNSIQTNLTTESLSEIINMQLDSGANWNIETNSVSGEAAMGLPSYAMPNSYLYFTKLDEQSVIDAKDKINSIMSNSKS